MMIAINPDKFDKLITALRTAVDNDGSLDKKATSYNDIFDAFRLGLCSITLKRELFKSIINSGFMVYANW